MIDLSSNANRSSIIQELQRIKNIKITQTRARLYELETQRDHINAQIRQLETQRGPIDEDIEIITKELNDLL